MNPVIQAFAHFNPKLLTYQPTRSSFIFKSPRFEKPEKGKFWIFCGPGGSGKDTLIQNLLADYPEKFRKGVTSTTRPKRPEEKEGLNYFFLSGEEFFKTNHLERNFFNGAWYGIPTEEANKATKDAKTTLFQIDLNGLRSFKKTGYAQLLVSFFILPESWGFLKKNYAHRKNPKARMAIARQEINQAHQCDFLIVNRRGKIQAIATDLVGLAKK